MQYPARARAQYSGFPRRYTVIRYRIDRQTDVHEKVMEITTMWGSLRLAPIKYAGLLLQCIFSILHHLAIQDYDPISNSPVAVNAMKVRFCQNITIVDDTVSEPTLRFSLQLIPFSRGFEQIVYLNTTTIVIIDNDGCNRSMNLPVTNCSTNIPVTNCSTNTPVTNTSTNTPETVNICVNTVSKGSFIAALVILLIIVIVLIRIIILLGLSLLCYKHHKDSENK